MSILKGVMALRRDGGMSICTASEETRGTGRCNHIAHQEKGETIEQFTARINALIKVDEDYSHLEQVDFKEAIDEIINENALSFNKNPDWKEYIMNLDGATFSIGSAKDGSLEHAVPVDVKQETIIDKDGAEVEHLTMVYEFRGEQYEVDFGNVPKVQKDGSIQIGESSYRVLPVMAPNKSGYIQYENGKIGVLSKESTMGFNKFAFFMDTTDGSIQIGKTNANPEEVQKYLNGEESKLTDLQKKMLDKIDPIAFERLGGKFDLEKLRSEYKADEPNDIEWRKFQTYDEQVGYNMKFQLNRMGRTFRTNLAKHKETIDKGITGEELEKIKAKYPLFYQQKNTENIKQDLLSRSNVQLADNLNPLSALSQSRKVALAGKGGYSKERAMDTLRKIHPSHKGVLDQLDTSSGKNIGLTAVIDDGDIDSRGFIVPGKGQSVSRFVPFKTNNDPNRATMAVSHMKQAVPVLGGEDPRKLGDSSDEYWDKIKGSKLGVNLSVAYVPTKGTFEDSVTISESAARKMCTKQSQKYQLEAGEQPPKIGSIVKDGQYVAGVKVKHGGVIKESGKNSFQVETTYHMGVGDKIAGRHGNKGTVSKVLPDSQMPMVQQEDGTFKPAEIIMSPMGVPGRMNPSQIYETNGGQGKFNDKKKVKLPSGNVIENTAGTQYVMRLNHIAEKKIIAVANERDGMRDQDGLRMGEMESLLLSTNPERLELLREIRNQENSDAMNKFNSLLKSIGVEVESK